MKLRLRGRILIAAVIPVVALAAGTVTFVYEELSSRAHHEMRAGLARSAATVDQALASRAHGISTTVEGMVRDPRLAAVLEVPATDGPRPEADALAAELNARGRFALLEIRDVSGGLVAAAGDDEAGTAAEEHLLEDALLGRSSSGIVVRHGRQYQASARPVLARGRIIGAVILGEPLGAEFAARLGELTGSEITFVSGSAATATTLDRAADAQALVRAIRQPADPARPPGSLLEIAGAEHRYLALARPLPEARLDLAQSFVVERAIDVETRFLDEARNHLLELGLVAILVALLLGFFVADGTVRPLERVTRAIEEVARGNPDYPLPAERRDEIGDLVRCVGELQQRHRPSGKARSTNSQGRGRGDYEAAA